MSKTQSNRLLEVIQVFLWLGLTAFGGPAAHIGLMQDEFVKRRKWVNEQQFLDLLGATNLIPGPNSTEMAIHLGFLRAGYPGLIAAGICFILPAMAIVLGIAWVYVTYGSTPQADWLLYGIKPVVIAVIVQALWGLGKKAIKNWLTAAAGVVVFVLFLLRVNELLLLFSAGLVVMLIVNLFQNKSKMNTSLPAWFGPAAASLMSIPTAAVPFSQCLLFFTFLKIGSVLYGSGYVLLAFLRADFVERLGWLTEKQLIDAVAVGQVTPGPVFTTATFLGYLFGGVPGAILATIAIFLPAFVFVAISNPLIPRLRQSTWAGALLDGVNVASLGLMAGVTVQLAMNSLTDVFTILICLVSATLLMKFRVNATWLVLAGGILGLVYYYFSTYL